MKSFVFLVAFLAPVILMSQDSKEKASTQAEEFSAQSGTLMERAFVDIGTVKNLKVRVLKIKDLISSKEVNALRFEYETGGTYGSTKIASLDSDEIDGLVKSIKALQNSVFTSTREVYTEVTFKSRSGFQAGAYFSVDKSKWTGFVQVDKFDSKSLVFITPEDFTKLLELVEMAQKKM